MTELPTAAHNIAFESIVQLLLVPLKIGWHMLWRSYNPYSNFIVDIL